MKFKLVTLSILASLSLGCSLDPPHEANAQVALTKRLLIGEIEIEAAEPYVYGGTCGRFIVRHPESKFNNGRRFIHNPVTGSVWIEGEQSLVRAELLCQKHGLIKHQDTLKSDLKKAR